MATLQKIFISPIKSCGLMELPWSTATSTGLLYDRSFMVVDERGRFVTQRNFPAMSLIKQRLDHDPESGGMLSGPDTLILSYPHDGIEDLEVPLSASTGVVENASVFRKPTKAAEVSEVASSWFTKVLNLGRRPRPYRLVHCLEEYPRSSGDPNGSHMRFQDAYPYSVVTTASMERLNRLAGNRSSTTLGPDRFRPTFVIEENEGKIEPNSEDTWTLFTIGHVSFTAHGPIERCQIPRIDPKTGNLSPEPVRTLLTYRTGRHLSQPKPDATYMCAYACMQEPDSHIISVGMRIEFV